MILKDFESHLPSDKMFNVRFLDRLTVRRVAVERLLRVLDIGIFHLEKQLDDVRVGVILSGGNVDLAPLFTHLGG